MGTPYGVEGLWNCALAIGGQEYPATTTNIVELLWFESVHQSLPSLNLTIKDWDESFAKIASVGDGVKIDITLGDGKGGETSATFNIQGPPQITPGNGYNTVKMNAVLDAIEYNRKIPQGLYEGTSNDAISKLAGEAGLTPVTPTSTNDSQVWLPNNNSIVNFVKSIAQHAYAGDSSAMTVGVTDQRQLIFGDANDLINQSTGVTLGYDESQGHIIIQDWNGTSSGMVANNFKSYGATTAFWTPEGILSELNKVTATLFGTNLFSFSSQNSDRIGDMGTRVDMQPRPAGNTHDKYNEAAHINTRTRSMWNVDFNCTTYQYTGIQLLSGVDVAPYRYGLPGQSEIFTGRMLLTAKTKALFNSKYVERLTLTTNGGA